ncbi:MAG TPA: PAS domain S-box protein, partial [Candidatus Aminicenantes bacterium]|nr:PAS domain S-box protein [Candidatus Aminicenantes bacterium]
MIAKFDIFKYIVEKALDGIYIISQERLEYVNPAFEKLTGISKEVIHSIGLNFLDRVHPDDQKMLIERRKARREGKAIPSTYEIRGIEKDGTYRYFEFNTVVIPDHPDLVLGIVRDVTERKAAERTRKALRESEIFCDMVMERANEGIAIIQEGRIVYANPFLMRNTGYRKEEIIGKPFHTFVATAYLDQILDYNRRRTSGGAAPSSYEATIKLAGNQRAFVEINVSEMNYQGKPGLFTVIHNITKHKETEIELRDTLAQLREAMNATTEAIARIVEHKDPYTAGHQRRVADLARAIAAEMGLSQEQIDSIRMAGLLHDLGKVSVPSEILTKPTMLTETEFKLIEEHPRVAYDILK